MNQIVFGSVEANKIAARERKLEKNADNIKALRAQIIQNEWDLMALVDERDEMSTEIDSAREYLETLKRDLHELMS